MHIKIASSCVRGIAHKALDMPCQDYVASMQEDQRAVIALADGAGSRMFSQIGAQIATQTVCKICMEAFDSLFEMQEEVLAHYLSEKIQNELHNGTYSLSELSCTLLFYAMDKDRFISGHIGDGMIFRIRNTEADIYRIRKTELKQIKPILLQKRMHASISGYKGTVEAQLSYCAVMAVWQSL
ncbi:MAG: protein phosphatase 2C domain-containing protein [[Clostridium] innocuum]